MNQIAENKKRLARAICKELTTNNHMKNKITSILVNKLSHKDLDLIILNMIIKQQN